MIPAERHKTILELLSQHEVISIKELSDQLNVSHMTIRRDIAKLEEREKVSSVSGGVQLIKSLYSEALHDIKSVFNVEEKSSIGEIASQLIPPNSSVYLDAGTTMLEIAHYIACRNDLLIITNDFVIASYLSHNSVCELYHTGGRINKDDQSSVGSKVADFLACMNIDIAFISTYSWNLRGISTPSEQEVVVKKAVVAAAQTNVLVTDSSRYGRVEPFHAISIECFHTVVTDTYFPISVQHELEEKGVQVIQESYNHPMTIQKP